MLLSLHFPACDLTTDPSRQTGHSSMVCCGGVSASCPASTIHIPQILSLAPGRNEHEGPNCYSWKEPAVSSWAEKQGQVNEACADPSKGKAMGPWHTALPQRPLPDRAKSAAPSHSDHQPAACASNQERKRLFWLTSTGKYKSQFSSGSWLPGGYWLISSSKDQKL